MSKAYEIRNPSISGTLDQQIEWGCNDWAAEGKSGHVYVGETASKAEMIRKNYNDE